MEKVLKSGYYRSNLDYDNVDFFGNEVIKIENKIPLYFKNTEKNIIMTEEDEEDSENNKKFRFCEKEILSDKVRDHCSLTGAYRGQAYNKCIFNVTHKLSNFIPLIIHKLSTYDCQTDMKKLVDKKNAKVEFDFSPKTNEEYTSVPYGCIRFIDTYRFSSSSQDKLVKTLENDDFNILKKKIYC